MRFPMRSPPCVRYRRARGSSLRIASHHRGGVEAAPQTRQRRCAQAGGHVQFAMDLQGSCSIRSAPQANTGTGPSASRPCWMRRCCTCLMTGSCSATSWARTIVRPGTHAVRWKKRCMRSWTPAAAEHNVGHPWHAPASQLGGFRWFDSRNVFNPDVGQSSRLHDWPDGPALPQRNQAGYSAPSTRRPLAPLTLGRLPGRPARVSRASQAKPMAST